MPRKKPRQKKRLKKTNKKLIKTVAHTRNRFLIPQKEKIVLAMKPGDRQLPPTDK